MLKSVPWTFVEFEGRSESSDEQIKYWTRSLLVRCIRRSSCENMLESMWVEKCLNRKWRSHFLIVAFFNFRWFIKLANIFVVKNVYVCLLHCFPLLGIQWTYWAYNQRIFSNSEWTFRPKQADFDLNKTHRESQCLKRRQIAVVC